MMSHSHALTIDQTIKTVRQWIPELLGYWNHRVVERRYECLESGRNIHWTEGMVAPIYRKEKDGRPEKMVPQWQSPGWFAPSV